MSGTLRIILLIVAVITAVWILSRIRRLKVKMEDAIFWIIFAIVLLILGIFPSISYRLASALGVISPANLIFMIVIFLLVEKVFTMSILISQLEEKVTVLSSEIALRSHGADQRFAELEGEHIAKHRDAKALPEGDVKDGE